MTCDSQTTTPAYGVQEAFQMFYPSYAESHTLSEEQEKAAFSISSCKTGKLGYNISRCPECGHLEIHACSCNNRHCPCCQYPLEQKWILQRASEMIPDTAYYHVVFTIPSELYDLAEANQKELYGLMFRASSDTLVKLCKDPKWLGAKPGIISVLHTAGQKLNYHPHIHAIVTGGGLTSSGRFIKGPHKGFLIPTPVVARVFRAKYLEGLKSLWKKEKLIFPGKLSKLRNRYEWKEYIDSLFGKEWLPFLKETFNGKGNAMKYLARYTFRTAISNSRIDSVDADGVTFHYKDYADGGKQKTMTMDGEGFIAAFLRHILPSGFHRVRFSGFLSNSVKAKSLALIHKLLGSVYAGDPVKGKNMRDLILYLFNRDICECPDCKGTMLRLARGVPLAFAN